MNPRLLDLFCGAGGAAMGYARAGFEVVGVDINPQPHYPFEFIEADAIELLDLWQRHRLFDDFDAIHASPPCQDHSSLSAMWADHGTGWMLAETVERVKATGLPWVVENVVGPDVHMDGWWFTLCGSSFGLAVRRHRRFGSNLLMLPPSCRHQEQDTVVGVYGHPGGSSTRDGDTRSGTAGWRKAMGIDWMTGKELAQAIPPAYTEWIGQQLMAALEVAA